MRKWVLLLSIVGILLSRPNLVAQQIRYQYATFVEIETTSESVKVVLGFSTDPGYPITVIGEGNAIEASQNAYRQLYKEMRWPDTKKYDDIYVLNRLGSDGWEVIHVRETATAVFTSREPAIETKYLLKKKVG